MVGRIKGMAVATADVDHATSSGGQPGKTSDIYYPVRFTTHQSHHTSIWGRKFTSKHLKLNGAVIPSQLSS
jgi:hypothetical protein